MGRRRRLLPGAAVLVGADELWVFDCFHPVAVVLDRWDGAVRSWVSWPQVPPPLSGWRIAVHESVVWLQPQPAGPLLQLTSDGLRSGHFVDTMQIAAAGPGGAWCIPALPASLYDSASHAVVPPRDWTPIRGTRALLVGHDDDRREVAMPGRIRRLVPTPGGISAQLDVAPWRRRQLGPPRVIDGVEIESWETVWESAWVQVPDGYTGDRVKLSRHGIPAPADPRPVGTVFQGGSPWSWHALEREQGNAVPAAGLAWTAGWDRPAVAAADGRRRPSRLTQRPLTATGHDPADGVEKARVEIGAGQIQSLTAGGDDLCIVVTRETVDDPPHLRHELIRLNGRTGRWELLTDVGSLDLDGRGWPLAPEPADAQSYEQWCLRSWSTVQDWSPSDGTRHPLAEGVSEATVELVGTWPDTVIRLEFSFVRRPGRRLVHERQLFDDLGRPGLSSWDLVFVTEQLHTGLPDAVDGPNASLLI